MSRTTESTSVGHGHARPIVPPWRYRPDAVAVTLNKWRARAPAALALAVMFTVSGCSLPNLSMSSSVGKTKPTATASHATTSPSNATSPATMQPSTSPAPVRPAGVLDTGSVTHKVAVGAFWAVIVYYTADNATLYRDSSTKTIRVAAHIEGADKTQTILVNDFVATADDGVTRAVIKNDSRSFAITPPQSYNSVVTIPATTDKATTLTLIVELDFSVQTTPTSKLYAAQTALDSITVPLLAGSQK
jgi:hypothetical protein